MVLVIRNYRSPRRMGPFAWTLFENQIINEDPCWVLSSVRFILATASVTDNSAALRKEHNLMKEFGCT